MSGWVLGLRARAGLVTALGIASVAALLSWGDLGEVEHDQPEHDVEDDW